MLRKTLTIVSLVGLLVGGVLWAASYWHPQYFLGRPSGVIHILDGAICHTKRPYYNPFGKPMFEWGKFDGFGTIWHLWRPGLKDKRPQSVTYGQSLWAPMLLFATLPTCDVGLAVRRRKRRKLGLCIGCGYELTGLTEPRCPECNTPFDL